MTRKINLAKEKRLRNEEYAKKFDDARKRKAYERGEKPESKKEQRKRIRAEKRDILEKLYEQEFWERKEWLINK